MNEEGVNSQKLFRERERDSLISCDSNEKNSHELSFNLDRGVDVDLDLEGNIHAKNLLSFYKQKITLLVNQNFFSIKPKHFFATSN